MKALISTYRATRMTAEEVFRSGWSSVAVKCRGASDAGLADSSRTGFIRDW
jgi:hypothetical protein